MSAPLRADVVVVGAGPAGLSLAAELIARSVETLVVAPSPTAVWQPTYGCWVDELEALGLGDVLAHRWDEVLAVGERPHALGRAYCVIDNAALQSVLSSRLDEGTVLDARVTAVVHESGYTELTTTSDQIVARLVIDASGHEPVVLRTNVRPRASRIAQAAVGMVATFERSPVAAGTCVLMDWTPPADRWWAAEPTFLYAFDLGDGRAFVEETSLARQPSMTTDELTTRLNDRLARLGAVPSSAERHEQVWIPLDPARPDQRDQAVGFGAAGGYVHPATGYSVVRSLAVAPLVADAVATALAEPIIGKPLASTVWDAVWPRDACKARAMQEYGLSALLRMDGRMTRRFFDAFFQLPTERWSSYLSGMAPSAEIRATMGHLFRSAPLSVKATLASGNPMPLLRSLTS
jgi:lycopene beta-cyclase